MRCLGIEGGGILGLILGVVGLFEYFGDVVAFVEDCLEVGREFDRRPTRIGGFGLSCLPQTGCARVSVDVAE